MTTLPAKPTLLDDRRGAILVMAVFMAVFLVGCLWYLIGIGDAAIYRQKMQDGADAAAYVSAVYHARGMNLIAVMNLIMAAVLAILIALKVLQIVSGIVTIGAGIVCAIPFGQWACPIASFSGNVYSQLTTNIIPKAQQVVDKVLKALSFAQKGVALSAPYIGAYQGYKHAQNYAPSVDEGVSLSISMVPGQVSGDKRIGLPVQEMGFPELCAKSGRLASDLVTSWLPGSWSSFIGGVVESTTGTFSTFFCGGGGPAPSGTFSGSVDANKSCSESQQAFEEAHKKWEQQKAEAEKNNKPFNADEPEFDMKKCKDQIKDCNKKPESCKNGKDKPAPDPNADKQMDSTGKTAKEIYYRASNGDDYFGVFGFVWGNIEPVKRADKAVELPAWGKAPASDGLFDEVIDVAEKIGFARADFYYDQTSADEGGLAWSGYKADALWHIRWRARLRRFRLPTPDVGAGFISNGTTKIPGLPDKLKIGGMDALGKKIKQVVGNDYIGGLLKKQIKKPGQIGGDADAWLDQFLGGASDGFILH